MQNILNKFSHASQDSLIPMLQEVQDELGYLSEASLTVISKHLNVSMSKIFGLATFYNQFRFQPKGVYHIKICNGTSCHIMGSQQLLKTIEDKLSIKPGQTSRNGKFSLEEVSCIGACGQSPALSINELYYGKLTTERLDEIIDDLNNES